MTKARPVAAFMSADSTEPAARPPTITRAAFAPFVFSAASTLALLGSLLPRIDPLFRLQRRFRHKPLNLQAD
jgi:hypothetical protein